MLEEASSKISCECSGEDKVVLAEFIINKDSNGDWSGVRL